MFRNIIFIASQAEAVSLIENNKLQAIDTTCCIAKNFPPDWTVIDEKTLVIQTGIGPYATHLAIDEYIRFFTHDVIRQHRWLNIGIAGAIFSHKKTLNNKDLLDTPIHISSVSLLEWHPIQGLFHSEKYVNIQLHTLSQEIQHLVTSPLPVRTHLSMHTASQTKNTLFLVDMEAYSIAHYAMQLGIHLDVVKFISDFCDKKTANRIQHSIREYSKKIAKYAMRWATTSD